MLLLSYPTPQIAGQRFREFEKHPEWKARRYGPMLGVVLDAPEPAGKAPLRHLLSADCYME